MADPWISFYSSDFLAGVSGLTAAERGVYITLLALMFEAAGPISLDKKRLARRCGSPRNFAVILKALIDEGKIEEAPDGLSNARAMVEIEKRKIRTEQARKGASMTNAARSEKKKQNQSEVSRQARRSAIREPEPHPEPYPESKSSVSKDTGSDDPPDLKKVAFDNGIKLLSQAGIHERRARPLIGRWVKDHGEAEVITALGKAQREGAIDPVSFVEGCFRYAQKKAEPKIGDVRTLGNGKRQEYNGRQDGWITINEY